MITQERLEHVYHMLADIADPKEVKAESVRYDHAVHGLILPERQIRVDAKNWFATATSDKDGLLGPWTVYGENSEGQTITYTGQLYRDMTIPIELAMEIVKVLRGIGEITSYEKITKMHGQTYITMKEQAGGQPIKVVKGWTAMAGHGWTVKTTNHGFLTSPLCEGDFIWKLSEGPLRFVANIDDGTTYETDITVEDAK